MSIISDKRDKVTASIDAAKEAVADFMDTLEADEDFGHVYDGSTYEDDLHEVAEHLYSAMDAWRVAHKTNHFGLA